jgi:hypothetical protein
MRRTCYGSCCQLTQATCRRRVCGWISDIVSHDGVLDVQIWLRFGDDVAALAAAALSDGAQRNQHAAPSSFLTPGCHAMEIYSDYLQADRHDQVRDLC